MPTFFQIERASPIEKTLCVLFYPAIEMCLFSNYFLEACNDPSTFLDDCKSHVMRNELVRITWDLPRLWCI
jgi:hypothetical protein